MRGLKVKVAQQLGEVPIRYQVADDLFVSVVSQLLYLLNELPTSWDQDNQLLLLPGSLLTFLVLFSDRQGGLHHTVTACPLQLPNTLLGVHQDRVQVPDPPPAAAMHHTRTLVVANLLDGWISCSSGNSS